MTRNIVLSALAVVSLLVSACNKGDASPSAATPTTLSATPAAAPLAEGGPAPTFHATASDGTVLDSSALRGHPVVVYFYPKDETAGCTKEACSFRDAWDKLAAKGVTLVGVSSDSDESHRKFSEHHKLPFKLVSDPDGKLARAFEVPVTVGFTARHSFVIDGDGKIKKIYRSVDVAKHAQEILDAL